MNSSERLEFIVALTEHRHLGLLYTPYLAEQNLSYYAIKNIVRHKEIDSYGFPFDDDQREIVRLCSLYADEKIVAKFSRLSTAQEFYNSLAPDYFTNNIAPYIDKLLFACSMILLKGNIRLFNKESKYTNLYDEDIITVERELARPHFLFRRHEGGTEYRLRISLHNEEIKLVNRKVKTVVNNPCVMVVRDQLIVCDGIDAKKIGPFLTREAIQISKEIEPRYYQNFILNLLKDHQVQAEGFRIVTSSEPMVAALSLEPDLNLTPVLVLRFCYGNSEFLHNSIRKVTVRLDYREDEITFHKAHRNVQNENEVLRFLADTGLIEKNGAFKLPNLDLLEPQEAVHQLVEWMNLHQDEFQKMGIVIRQGAWNKKFFIGEQKISVELNKNGDWFDVYATVQIGSYQFPFIKLKRYILNDIREFELPNGEIAVLPVEWFARYKALLPFAKSEGVKLSFFKHHYTILRTGLTGLETRITERLETFYNQDKESESSVPEGLQATMRNYQKKGYNWLLSLYKSGMGGCLADDMGLGKTLQTLTLLLKLKNNKEAGKTVTGNKNLQPASLIVVPTSLIHNWENEIAKFTPTLSVFRHTGGQRDKSENFYQAVMQHDVILTTYGVLRNDIELFSSVYFFYIILDESQYIKNPTSKIYQAVIELKSKQKLALTGTPVENSLSDLWSQMNFLNRGLLGGLTFFRVNIQTPIEKQNDPEVQKRLQLMISPFILRRSKSEVASDLPPLMEQVRYCTMTPEQQSLYETEKSIIRNSILQSIETNGLINSSLVVLQGLTRLRQLANHPMLIKGQKNYESGKFNEIFDALTNLVAENHKVLIFSSFVTHLELIRKRVETEGWKYSLLTGSTTHREQVINDFQDDPENRIFLISLKAGGVGLNLTGADYVFIIDPWWNPASENQAISRAHRIGQDKHVFVYRFITENTIEEKIQRLKERKSALADKFINSNNPFREISREEILSLFG